MSIKDSIKGSSDSRPLSRRKMTEVEKDNLKKNKTAANNEARAN